MGRQTRWAPGGAIIACALSLLGCASTQLNYNTQDLASTVDTLVTDQVLSNLAKFINSPNAIPSQITILTGTVTTNDVVNPTITSPLNLATAVTNTAANTLGATPSTTLTNAAVKTQSNLGATLLGTDQWTQTWGIAPLIDPDQLRRLRVLYQFGAGQISERDLRCNYPIIQMKPGGGSDTSQTAKVTVPVDGANRTVTLELGPSEMPKPKTTYVIDCKSHTYAINADPAFLNNPSCVICLPDHYVAGSQVFHLEVNRRLQNNWLRYSDGPFALPEGAIMLGHYQHKYLYVASKEDLSSFYEFALFVLEATAQSATSATGQSLGKGPPSSAPALLTAPSVILQ